MTMTTANLLRLLSTLAVVLLLSVQAQAQSANDRPFYAGASIGAAFGDVDGYSSADLVGTGTLKSVEDSLGEAAEGSWRLYAGYSINDYLDAEISYANLGTFERGASRPTGTTTFVPLLGAVADYRCIDERFETTNLGLSLLFHPGPDTPFYGKLSANFWDTESATRSYVRSGGLFSGFGVLSCDGGVRRSSSNSGTDLGVGAGMRFSVGEWVFRTEIERIGGLELSPSGEAVIYTLSIGAEFRF